VARATHYLLRDNVILLLLFLLFVGAYLVAATCDDELAIARQPALLLLAFFLLATVASVLTFIPLWLQTVVVLFLLVAMLKLPVLFLYRWLSGGLALFLTYQSSLFGLATLLLATIAAATLLAGAEKREHTLHSRLLASAKWAFHPMLISGLIVFLPYLARNL
jgi:hypothetical protein